MHMGKSHSSGSHDSYIDPAETGKEEKKPYMFTIHYVSNETYLRKGQTHTGISVRKKNVQHHLRQNQPNPHFRNIPRMPTSELNGLAALFYNQ